MPTLSTEEHRKEVGQWLRKQRNAADLTQSQVANGAGITDVQYARIEKGESGTKRETFVAIIETINKKSTVGYKVDLNEALDRLFGRQTEPSKFSGLDLINFDGLENEDIKDIREFVEFKKWQRAKAVGGVREVSGFSIDEAPINKLSGEKIDKNNDSIEEHRKAS